MTRTEPAVPGRPARLTIRARLTLMYGGLLLLAGMLILGVTYALVAQGVRPGGASRHSSYGTAPSEGAVLSGAIDKAEGPIDDAVGAAQQDVLDSLRTQGVIALVVVGVVAIAAGWLIAGRLLRPLHHMTETARRIAEAPAADRGLHERIALRGPNDELQQLADTFDVMLARLDHAFDGQRRFIANASHELRTPLSLNRALIEVAVREGASSPEVRQLGGTLLEINDRHGRLIDGLLLLARSEQEAVVAERSFVDLADVVEHVADQTPRAGVTLVTDTREAPTSGNPVLLERLVQNLVENGIRHNLPEGGWLRVATATVGASGGASVGAGPGGESREGRWVELKVSNSGPPVAPYDIPSLFEPFRRLHADRLSTTPGSGLGLSIVRAVARAHGGEAHAAPRDGGGLVVTVRLRAAPEDAEST